jgi:nucleotide-binding universal stress UspA family protein
MIEIRRILCPIDFSDYSRRALDHAVAIARWYGSTITVMHAFSPAPVATYAPGAHLPGAHAPPRVMSSPSPDPRRTWAPLYRRRGPTGPAVFVSLTALGPGGVS